MWDYYCQPISHVVGGCLAQEFEAGCGVGLQVWILVAAMASVGVQVVCLASLALYRGFKPLGMLN